MDMIQEYIWFALGGAAFVAFLLGLIIRGMMSAGKTRRATVERDVAITELEQVRSELDSLYAAQRKQREQAAASSAIAPEELKERDERLAQVSSELESAKAELQALRDARTEAPEQSAGSDEVGELKSRNSYLEERVGELEAKIHELGQAPAASAESSGDEDPEQKKDWQIDFLKTRVAALEEKQGTPPLLGDRTTMVELAPTSTTTANPIAPATITATKSGTTPPVRIAQQNVAGDVLESAAPTWTTKTVSESTTVQGATNTLTFTMRSRPLFSPVNR